VRFARVLTLVLAVVVCAWFALGIHQASTINDATRIISHPSDVTSAQAAHAASLLRSARTLNPDTEVDVLRARLAVRDNHPADAQRTLLSLVRSEPMNLEAWILLARISGADAATERFALRRIAQLDPEARARR
jgi:predicted Zn-dependent protease